MESYVSVYTLKTFDNLLSNYKKKVLEDFYINFINNKDKEKMSYQEFENKFLERDKKPIIKNKDIDIDKCHAYIWKKNYGKIQCSHNKSKNNYCLFHVNKQNYGSITEFN